jgi:hypothetical protein
MHKTVLRLRIVLVGLVIIVVFSLFWGRALIFDLSLLTVSKLLNQLPPVLSLSTKTIRRELHGDAELTIARLYPHHARFALEGLVFETEGEPDRVSD